MAATGYLDACGFNPASGGTGDFVVSAAITGYRTPASAGAVNSAVYSYRAQSTDLTQWEDGSGPYATGTTTLARTTVTASSTGSKVSFTAPPNVYITAMSADLQNAALLTNGQFGFHNRIINPSGQVWQRINSGAAAVTDVTYCFDRWYGLTQSAGITASQVSNAANGTPYMMRLSQANATAQRFGIAQVIESANCIDMRGQTVTLSAQVRMSAATTLRYAIVEWTGTADAITKDIVNDWTNGTFTTGNFFISTTTTITATGSIALSANTLAPVSLTGTVSGSMNNIIAFFWTDSTQAQNVTMDAGNVQLEIGSNATPLAMRSIQQELAQCQRYYLKTTGKDYITQSTLNVGYQFKVIMRVTPSLTISTSSGTFTLNGSDSSGIYGTCSSQAETAITANAEL